MRTTQEVTTDEHGDDAHPAFAMIGASRVSVVSTSKRGEIAGAVLFDSDITHQHTIRIRIRAATRRRQLNRDWIHGREQYIEVELSEAQWASFVSAMNVGDGVPCTLRALGRDEMPELPFDPRLAHSMDETRDAADRAFDAIKRARDTYEEALANKAGAAERKEKLRNLHFAIENATANVTYAGDTLAEHAESVVTKARADIEAFVVTKAHSLGIAPEQIGAHPLTELTEGN